jgi:hypothetical protein
LVLYCHTASASAAHAFAMRCVLYPVSAALASSFRVDSFSTSYGWQTILNLTFRVIEYKSVNFGAKRDPDSPNWRDRIDCDRARPPLPSESNCSNRLAHPWFVPRVVYRISLRGHARELEGVRQTSIFPEGSGRCLLRNVVYNVGETLYSFQHSGVGDRVQALGLTTFAIFSRYLTDKTG